MSRDGNPKEDCGGVLWNRHVVSFLPCLIVFFEISSVFAFFLKMLFFLILQIVLINKMLHVLYSLLFW